MRITKADAKRYVKENCFSFVKSLIEQGITNKQTKAKYEDALFINVANGTLIINYSERVLEWQE